MTSPKDTLTGVWHGLYSYKAHAEPVYFVATLIQSGTHISGLTHESEIGKTGAPLVLYAGIEGARHGTSIQFTKSYDGSGGWDHSVAYDGILNGEATEIEGRWVIGQQASGKFLMIRTRGVSEAVVREAFEKV
jgi:hypothetical protein